MTVVQQPFSSLNDFNLKMPFCYAMNPNAKEKKKKRPASEINFLI